MRYLTTTIIIEYKTEEIEEEAAFNEFCNAIQTLVDHTPYQVRSHTGVGWEGL